MLRTELFNVDTILERLLPWVREESPTYHVAGVNRMMDLVGADLAAIGGVIERVPGTGGRGDIVLARFAGRDGTNSPGILILSHLDTDPSGWHARRAAGTAARRRSLLRPRHLRHEGRRRDCGRGAEDRARTGWRRTAAGHLHAGPR